MLKGYMVRERLGTPVLRFSKHKVNAYVFDLVRPISTVFWNLIKYRENQDRSTLDRNICNKQIP